MLVSQVPTSPLREALSRTPLEMTTTTTTAPWRIEPIIAHVPLDDGGGCYSLLVPRAKGRPAWFFLGNLPMINLTHKVVHPRNVTSRRDACNGHCSVIEYYGLTRAEVWRQPIPGHQGLTAEGLAEHFCLDVTSHHVAPQRGKGNQ